MLIAEVFNLVLVFVSVGIIPFGFMPDINLMYLNNGISFTVNIIAICIVGIIFGAIAKRGNFVIAIIYLSLFLITQFAIILNNMWFGGVAFLIIWIACLFSFARMFVFRDREELAQKKADQLKLEAEKEAKKTEKKPAAAETKINRKRIWTENGFTYSNLP